MVVVQPLVEVMTALVQAEVDFVVVGGVAVVLQGHPRMTADLDVVLDLEQDNVLRAVSALQALGLVARLPVMAEELADPERRREWTTQRNMTVFSFHDPVDPRREVDIFVDPPIDAGELARSARRVQLGHATVQVASIDHLIRMKRIAGRPQDIADIDALQRILDAPGEGVDTDG